MTEAYPLYWPEGRKRTDAWKRTRSRFNTGFGAAAKAAYDEVGRLGGRGTIVSTNVPLRRDGLPLASAKRVDDAGAAIYFTYKDKQMCFACDRWDKVEDNIWAIAKTIEALRGIARWGTGDMLEAAFKGFAALPPPRSSAWHEVLDVSPDAPLSEIEVAYKRHAKNAHPDNGGSHDEMAKLNDAILQARKEKGV